MAQDDIQLQPKLSAQQTPLTSATTRVDPGNENLSQVLSQQAQAFEINEEEDRTSQAPSTITKKAKHDDFNGGNSDLESISSNETVHDAYNQPSFEKDTDAKEAMFAQDDWDYPEGGLKAFTVVFGAFMGLTPCFGILNSLGAIENYIAENQLANVDSSVTAWIFSIFLFVNFTSCIFSGTYFDRNGARAPLIVGTILITGGLFATANCKTVWQFILAFGIICGLGNGTTLSPLVSVVPHYFNKKRGFYTSLASTGGSLGGIIFPIMLRKLFQEVGYAWTIRIFAFVVLACHSLAIVFARERLPHMKTNKTKTEKVTSYLKAFDVSAFKEWKFVFVVLGCTFAEISITTTSTYYTSYARAQGATMSAAYLLTTIVNIGGIPGRWITGWLSDRVGRFNVVMSILVVTGIVVLVILIPFGQHQGALYAFSIVWGFFTGSIFSLLPVCCGQVSRTEEFGRRYSTMYFIVAFGTMASIPIGGAIINDKSSVHFNQFMIYCGVAAIAAAGFYTVARVLCVGTGLQKRF